MTNFEKKIGKLFFDTETQRIDIKFEDGTYYGGLHCGETLDYLRNNQWTNHEWIQTRIESDVDGEWYLVGLYDGGMIPCENTVRK